MAQRQSTMEENQSQNTSQQLGQPTAAGASVTVLESQANLGMGVTDNAFFKDVVFLFQSEEIHQVWNHEDPNQAVQEVLIRYFEQLKEKSGHDCQTYDKFENRYEVTELKWIADFAVNNLVFLRGTLGIQDPKILQLTLQVFWDTLDLFGSNNSQNNLLDGAKDYRFTKLRDGMLALFQGRALTKEQVTKCLEYARQSIFGHLQLYLSCMAKKQTKQQKDICMFNEKPQIASMMTDLEDGCREIVEEVRASQAGRQENSGSQELEVEQQDEEEQQDDVDPDDPIYGVRERIANLPLDEASKQLIVDRLLEASNKVKQGLVERQTNLESKISAMSTQGKKR